MIKKIFNNTTNTILTILSLLALAVPASAQTDSPIVKTQIIPSSQTIYAGTDFDVLIHQTIPDDWHTYWKNPGDSGAEPKFDFYMPDGFTHTPLEWSTPKRILISDLMNFGYEHDAYFKTTITPPANAPLGKTTIEIEAEWLVCHEECIPEFDTFEITLDLKPAAEKISTEAPAIFEKAKQASAQTVDWQTYFHKENDQIIITLSDKQFNSVLENAKDIEFFTTQWGIIDNPAPIITTETEGLLTLTTTATNTNTLTIKELPLIIKWHNTDTNRFESISVTALAHPDFAPIETEPTTSSSNVISETDNVGWIAAIGLAFLGGLVLNLMPCVFPVLSMKALSLVKMQEGEQRQALNSGLAYTAGVILSFLIIAGLLIALKSGGEEIGWGFQLQNPLVVTILAWLLFGIGLNLSGVFDISGRFMNAGQSLTQKSGTSGSFFTGVLATVVATPCTAPFMGTAMGYALTQPAFVSLSVFFALGAGLAFPYLALCAKPKLRHILPRPGEWMNTFKQFLAFPMYASAIWLTWVLEMQIGATAIIIALGGMLCISFTVWLKEKNKSKGLFRTTVRTFLIFISLLTLFKLAVLAYDSKAIELEITNDIENEYSYNKETYKQLINNDNPVFVNMTAAWCITCKINEKIALSTNATKELFNKHNVNYISGDWTNYDENITAYLETYGRNGVPLYVYYGPRDEKTGQRPDPVVLPQILTPSTIKDYIEN